MLSCFAADRKLTSVPRTTSEIVLNFSRVGWNWLRLYHWSRTPALHPSFQRWPSGWASSTTAFRLGYSHRPLSKSGIGTSTVSPTMAGLNLFAECSNILSACCCCFLFAPCLSSATSADFLHRWQELSTRHLAWHTPAHIEQGKELEYVEGVKEVPQLIQTVGNSELTVWSTLEVSPSIIKSASSISANSSSSLLLKLVSSSLIPGASDTSGTGTHSGAGDEATSKP